MKTLLTTARGMMHITSLPVTEVLYKMERGLMIPIDVPRESGEGVVFLNPAAVVMVRESV